MRWIRMIRQWFYSRPRFFSTLYLSSLSPWVWREILGWMMAGRPAPPPGVVKRRTIWSYAKRFRAKILVETGTHTGDTVAALLRKFAKIYSIELSPALHEQAKQRFEGQRQVNLVLGDSGVELRAIVQSLDQCTLFWLDGHWCGGTSAKGDKDTPVCEELACILTGTAWPYVILIDDARLFGRDPAYPSLARLHDLVAARRPDFELTVADDIVRIAPRVEVKTPWGRAQQTGRQAPT